MARLKREQMMSLVVAAVACNSCYDLSHVIEARQFYVCPLEIELFEGEGGDLFDFGNETLEVGRSHVGF